MNRHLIRAATGFAIALAAGAIGFVAGAQDAKPKEPERTLAVNQVARVGERVISAEEFIQRLVEREKLFADPDMRSATAALDSLIFEELLTSECNRLEAWPKKRELDAEYDALNKEFEDALARRNKDLAQPYTREEFIEKAIGLSVPEFENQMRQTAKLALEKRMVVNYWLLSSDSADAEGLMMASESEITKVRERLIKGEKIEQIAPKHSEEMQTRTNNGAIGTIYTGDGTLEPEVAVAFWKLELNSWSDVIKTTRGCWVVRKTKFYPGNQAPFFNLREECLARGNPNPVQLKKWQNAVASSGRYAYERRMPGWDVQAGE